MKFSQYIQLTENASHEISSYTAKLMIHEKCSNIITKDWQIYRGVPSTAEYMFGSAEFSTPRRSAHTSNYTTLLVDNDPAWSPYPKRSKSYTCVTNIDAAEGYGSIYRVYPYNGANIGICSSTDFWWSFPALLNTGIHTVSQFNSYIATIIRNLINREHTDESFTTLSTACNEVDQFLIAHNYDYKSIHSVLPDIQDEPFNLLMQLTINKTPMLIGLRELLNPTNNKFKRCTLSNTKSRPLPKNIEVWTDSPCVFKKIS